jgi:hypothetical protein
MSITVIDVPQCNHTKATCLSAWLQAHAATAKIDSITVAIQHDPESDNNRLVLPVHLTSLRTLVLENVRVTTADTAEEGAQEEAEAEESWGDVLLTPALSGLTRLDLLDCQVTEAPDVCG